MVKMVGNTTGEYCTPNLYFEDTADFEFMQIRIYCLYNNSNFDMQILHETVCYLVLSSYCLSNILNTINTETFILQHRQFL